jgi:hypothetical protein
MALTSLTNLQPNNIKVTGIATFDQTVGIAGTLTYEDVTNIDAVGLITARSGVSVSGGQVSVGAGTSLHSTGLDLGTGNITGHNLHSTGIITATSFSGSGANLTGISQVGGSTGVDFNDNVKARFGTGNDLSLFHDSNRSAINNSTGELRILSGSDVTIGKRSGDDSSYSEQLATFKVDGAVELYHNNSKKFDTTSYGARTTGNHTITGQLTLETDNQKAVFGAGSDLEVFSDGTNGVLKNVNGRGYIQSDTGINLTKNGNAETLAIFNADGGVSLYYDNENKFSTDSFGATTRHDSGTEVRHRFTTNGGTARGFVFANSSNHVGFKNNSGSTIFYVDSGSQAFFGNNAIPILNNNSDLGTSSLRWRNIYTNDLCLSNEGGANDVDGTWGNYTIQEGESDLFLINKRNGKKYKFNLTEVS